MEMKGLSVPNCYGSKWNHPVETLPEKCAATRKLMGDDALVDSKLNFWLSTLVRNLLRYDNKNFIYLRFFSCAPMSISVLLLNWPFWIIPLLFEKGVFNSARIIEEARQHNRSF